MCFLYDLLIHMCCCAGDYHILSNQSDMFPELHNRDEISAELKN